MTVLCAWCEGEGKEALICRIEPLDRSAESHGICETHEKRLLLQVSKLKQIRTVRHIPISPPLPKARVKASPMPLIH